jgi:thiosulfate dehydrogenase
MWVEFVLRAEENRTVKKFILGFIVGILLVFGGAFAYFDYGFAPVATSDSPMPMEKYLAKKALHARIEREAPKRDVSQFTTADLSDGATVYQKNCAFCHSLPNQPPSAPAKGMFPAPPQLFTSDGMVTDDPVGVTYWKVKNGIRLTGMPGFGASLTEQEMWNVSALLARADKLPPEVQDALKPVAAPSDPPDPPATNAVSTPEWKDARQISPPELMKLLSRSKASRPTILQVGYLVLYEGAHIPGAIYAGPASSAEGMARLRQEAARIPRDKEVVIYCGCCPWEKCPNVHPAYEELRKMGFTNLVVLLIPQDFHHDWMEPGYPVARGK